MPIERINEIIGKIPITLFLAMYLGYLGYDYYSFTHDSDSPFSLKITQVNTEKESKKKLEKRLSELNLFIKSLETKKLEVQKLAQDLQSMKNAIPDKIDIPDFMKMLITESKKMGLELSSLKPTDVVKKENYSEQNFSMNIIGSFVYLTAFIDRLSSVSEIVTLGDFSFKVLESKGSKNQDIEADFQIKAYKYEGSTADKLGKQDAGQSPSIPVGGKINPPSPVQSPKACLNLWRNWS